MMKYALERWLLVVYQEIKNIKKQKNKEREGKGGGREAGIAVYDFHE